MTTEHGADARELLEPARRELATHLALARQRGRAADTLWADGHHAEALALAGRALENAVAAANTVARGTGEPEAEVEAVLRSQGMRGGPAARVVAAVRAWTDSSVPARDADVRAPDRRRYHEARRARNAIVRALSLSASQRRTRRLALLAAGLTTLGLLGAGARALSMRPSAVGASWGDGISHAASRVIDGRNDTSWLTPDRSSAFVEVRLPAPQHVGRVELLNTSNAPFDDRATADYVVELRHGDRVLQTITGRWEFATQPQWTFHEVDLENVDHVRFLAATFHRSGGGLAELRLR